MKRLLLGLAVVVVCSAAPAQERRNFFNDPFEVVTAALPGCPVPEEHLLTANEVTREEHFRVERGTTCYRSGRCRLPNAYLYDHEIIPRVVRYLQQDTRFADSSVWVEGQRRWVFLKGCVGSAQQALDMERAARNVDDVETVINELMIGTEGPPPYRVRQP